MSDRITTTVIHRYVYDERGRRNHFVIATTRVHPTFQAGITFAIRHSKKADVESVDIYRAGWLARTYCGGHLDQKY